MDGILNNYKKDLVNINNQLSIGQTNVKNDIVEASYFAEKVQDANDTLEISEQDVSNADKNVDSAKQSTKSIASSIEATEGKIEGLKVKLANAPEDQKAAIQEQIDNAQKQLEEQKKQLIEANKNEDAAVDNQQQASTRLNEAKTAAQDTNKNVEENKSKQSEDQKNVDSLTEEQSSLEAQIEAEEAKETAEAQKSGETPTFDEAMSRATDNIKNADGSFDKNADGKSSHLEQSLALANQSKEDRAAIQKELTEEFDSTDHNFDKEAGKSATHGYAFVERDLVDADQVTDMLGGTSSENVAKMYQCAVPLNGDDVFKMEADTASELLKEANSPEGFSDANKDKILNALDNGLQGETPETHTKYNRQAVDVLTDNHTTKLSDTEIQSQIDTIKAKVSGENEEPLTEKEFRTITYLYDIEAGGDKIGITNWDGSLGVQEGQKFNKQAVEVIIKDDEPTPTPQGDIDPDIHSDVGNGSAVWKISNGNPYSNYGHLDGNSTGIKIDSNNPIMSIISRGDKKGYTDSVGGKSTFVTQNAYSRKENAVEAFRECDTNGDGFATYEEIAKHNNIELSPEYEAVKDYGIDINELEEFVTDKKQLEYDNNRSKNNALNSSEYTTRRDAQLGKYKLNYYSQNLTDMPFYKKAPNKQ